MRRGMLLLAVFAVVGCREESAPAPLGAGGFEETVVDETTSEIRYECQPAATSMSMMLAITEHACRLTLDRGFRYFEMSEVAAEGDRSCAFTLGFFHDADRRDVSRVDASRMLDWLLPGQAPQPVLTIDDALASHQSRGPSR